MAWLLTTWLPASEIDPPSQDPREPIAVHAAQASQWREGLYEVWLLHGDCTLRQGRLTSRSRDAVLWIERTDPLSESPSKVIAYLENDVSITADQTAGPPTERAVGSSRFVEMNLGKSWLGRFQSFAAIEVSATAPLATAQEKPPLYGRGVEALGWQSRDHIRAVQFAQPDWQSNPQPTVSPLLQSNPIPLPPTNPMPIPAAEPFPVTAPAVAVPTARMVNVIPRNGSGTNLQSFSGSLPGEKIWVVTGGVRVVVSGIEGLGAPAGVPVLPSGVVTIESDRIVAWTTASPVANGAGGAGGLQSNDGRWELYLEGNIVFREGDRVIYADRMFYDVNSSRGTILNAEMLTSVPGYDGLLRLKADVIRQLDEQNFLANGAALTSSRLGVPRYWFQSENMTLNLQERPRFDPFNGQPVIDPNTQQQDTEPSVFVTSNNNFIYVGGVPVLYWPVAATDATKPTFYIDRIRVKNDSVFGSQFLVDWDLYQVLGRRPIEGTKWTLATDYLSDRGPGLGSNFQYDRPSFLSIPGEVHGQFEAWGIKDSGRDNLGADRRALLPEEEFRGRAFWQHRQQLGNGFQFTAELGFISDRNFLEQYYEREWDLQKDQITGLELKRYVGNSSWSLTADAQVNEFFTQTERLPRFDHFLIGQSVLGSLTWFGHSYAGYEHLRTATPPSAINPGEVAKFDPLAWEADREGVRVGTRQEFDWPFQLGAVKVVPYAMGEAARWGEDLAGNEVTRYMGQTGIRASLPIWRADPMVLNTLFNLNGLAHKIVFDAEFLYADAEENFDTLPLYDQLDDDATEHFRRRLFFDTFGGPLAVGGPNTPLKYDERFFALRSGMQSWVTAPSTEIADDMRYGKFGIRQRWQTKRGLPGQERIVDWIVLDVEGFFFPKADENNFGQEWGLFDYDFRWHLGDRLTILSDGFADFFGQGLRTFTTGASMTRPERGNLYIGYRSIEGPISSNIALGSLSYRMSEKWIAAGGATYDFGRTGNIGQSLDLIRIGESALVRVGFNYDASRDNLGVNFSIEPRFLPSSRLGRVGGVQVPPAGAYGLE